MARPLRVFWPGTVYEITTKTMQSRFLLRPSKACRELVLGVIARALIKYPQISLYAFAFLSNHYHLLVAAQEADVVSKFVGYVNSNIARELGGLHHWKGRFWGRRFRPIPILDDEALVKKLRYLLAQGVKEGLVASPSEWPGATSLPGLLGEKMKGVWVDRNVDYRARRKKRPVLHAGRVEYDIELAVLPCWAHLTDAERHAKIRALIAEIEHEGKAARNGKAPLGVATVLAMHPHDQPEETTTTRAPACHTSVPALLRSFKALLRSVREAFVEAAQSVAKGVVSAIFPDGTFPPRRPFVPSLPLQHYLAAFVGS